VVPPAPIEALSIYIRTGGELNESQALQLLDELDAARHAGRRPVSEPKAERPYSRGAHVRIEGPLIEYGLISDRWWSSAKKCWHYYVTVVGTRIPTDTDTRPVKPHVVIETDEFLKKDWGDLN